MSPHDGRHTVLLSEHVTGARPADDAKLLALLSACAECRQQLEGLRRVAGRLDEAGAVYRDVRERAARAKAPATVPGEEIVAEFVRARAAELRSPRHGSRPIHSGAFSGWRLALWGAAAAAVAVATVLLRERIPAPGDRPAPLYLGPESPPGIVSPLGYVDVFGAFAWELDLPSGGWFEVRVFDAAEAAAGAVPLLESPRLRQRSWIPPEEDIARLPAWIRLEVQPFDATGQPFGSAASGEARRAPR